MCYIDILESYVAQVLWMKLKILLQIEKLKKFDMSLSGICANTYVYEVPLLEVI